VSGSFFLSYSRRDQDLALRLAGDLRAGGAAIWIDQVDIRPSDQWDRTVDAALRESRGVVLVLSPRSAASDHVLDEVAVALAAGKPVIPVLIEACQIPLRLARVQYIDATADYQGALARCRAAMADALQAPEKRGTPEAPAPAPAQVPPAPALPPEIIDNMTRLLIPYLGPISAVLAREEARGASSAADLAARLAARIPGDPDRARFLAAVRAAGEV
jgi:hypothetical protein